MRKLIEPQNKEITIARQCELLGLPHSTYYYDPLPVDQKRVEIMNVIDEIYLKFPYYGTRKMAKNLQLKGFNVGRKQARTLMRLMGIEAIYCKPKTSIPDIQHKKYPYLLKGLDINRPNQVWCTDITYIRLETGWTYLMAVMDWHSRRVISWGLSNIMDTPFCVDVLEKALKYGKPEIFNTDQGSQYTSNDFTDVLKKNKIEISMDGKGRYLDNIFIERLWRTVKYEDVYINDYKTISEAKKGLLDFFIKYNTERLHQALEYKTPDAVWRKSA